MATATPDHIENIKDSSNKSYQSRLNTVVGIDDVQTDTKRNDINYFYSSGNFHFVLEKGFKPETLESTELTSVPFLPDWHAGIISIHGIIMPVIDILKFAKTQKLDVSTNQHKKSFLLKLEHPEHRSIVFKLDTLPQAINTKKMKKKKAKKGSPKWIKNYLETDSVKLALIDHQKLFDRIINAQ